jgi:hypothetical protein
MVPADELIEVVWGSAPPSSVRATLQNYISRLRSTLTDVGEPRIRTLPHGYLITVLDDELDVSRFADPLCGPVSQARRDPRCLHRALDSAHALIEGFMHCQ